MAAVLKRPHTHWIGLLLSGLIVGTVGLWGWQAWQRSQQQAEQARIELKTAPVVRRDFTIRVSASGSIQPITPVNISPKQPGRLVELLVDQGDRVRAGQILARMDSSDLQGQLLRAQGTLAEADANLQKLLTGNRPQEIQQAEQSLQEARADMIAVQSTYNSNRDLYQSGAISQNELDRSLADYEAAEARIHRLEENLSLLREGARQEDIEAARARVLQAQGTLMTIQTQLDDTVVRAPFAGIITQKYADVGAFVTPTTSASATSSATSSSIVALASDLEAVASVAETDVSDIYPGQAVELRVDAFPNRAFQGEVRLVAPESIVVQNVTSFQVRITILDDPDYELKSGMNLTASFLISQRDDALLIPTTAIVSESQGTGVYILQSDSQPVFQLVDVGATMGSQTEVLEGLSEGDRVFTTFPNQRQPNDQPVRTTTFTPGSRTPQR